MGWGRSESPQAHTRQQLGQVISWILMAAFKKRIDIPGIFQSHKPLDNAFCGPQTQGNVSTFQLQTLQWCPCHQILECFLADDEISAAISLGSETGNVNSKLQRASWIDCSWFSLCTLARGICKPATASTKENKALCCSPCSIPRRQNFKILLLNA